MNEQEVREFEENIVKGANIAFQRLVNQKKKEDGELVFSRNGHIFRVKAVDASPMTLGVLTPARTPFASRQDYYRIAR